MIRVLIADESAQVTDNLSRRLVLEDDLEVCGSAADGEAAVQAALWLKPDVALVDAGLPGMDGGQTTQMLSQALPGTAVVMMSMDDESEAHDLAMVAGAQEFLHKPFTGDALVAVVHRVHAAERRQGGATARAAASVGADTPPVAGAGPLPARVNTRGVVTAVISGKGGVGRTMAAINLATLLAEKHRRRVALVDLSLQFGDVGAALNLPTDRTITDLVGENGAADSDVVGQMLVSGPGGVRVLLAPTSPELADYVSTAHVTSLVETLRRDFDFIVIDTPSYLNEVTIHAIEMADHIVMMTDLSVPGVKNARLTRGVLDAVGIDPTTVMVVANHRETAGELDRRGAETFLGAHISIEIPHAAELVAQSINKGVPFVIGSPSAAATTALRSILATIDPVSQKRGGTASTDINAATRRRGRRRLGFSR